MKSRIKFSLDFDTKQEIIEGVVTDSDDVRDSLAKAFTQSFNGSSLCQIKFRDGMIGPDNQDAVAFTITPIPDSAEGKDLVTKLLSDFSPQPFTGRGTL